ncbi:type II secretion system protein [Chloroflexota bacterium]
MQHLIRRFNRIHRGEKGLTLIELVVVVAILGILAAIIVPNVASWIGEGKDEAARTELYDVQLAMTAVMAKANISTVTELAGPGTDDLRGYPTGVTADLDGTPPDDDLDMSYYLIDPTSDTYTYAWDARGKISQYEDGTLVNILP